MAHSVAPIIEPTKSHSSDVFLSGIPAGSLENGYPASCLLGYRVKGFTAVLAITGASLSVIKYFSDREEHNATARRSL